MSKRLWMAIVALAGGVVALSGCVVVPDQPAYGYGAGYGYGYGGPPRSVYVAPPPVVVVPPSRHRYGYWYDRNYEGRRWR